MMSVLAGDQEALELWSKTRAWVISGQRKTLSRLGVAFDKVIFESDFLPEVAELTNQGLREGTLHRREDGMVIYATEREELEEMPLVRADGLPTQHMRALAYWAGGARARRRHLAAGLRHRVGRPRHLPPPADGRARRFRQRQRVRQRARAAATRPTTSSTAWSRARSGRSPPARRGRC